MSKPKIPKDKHHIICEKYRNGKTCIELAKEYNVSYGPILKILHLCNEPVFYRKPENNKTKTNLFDEEFFFVKNEKLAYFMGFALADGCLKVNHKTYTYSLKISVSKKDKYILDMFCDWSKFDHNKIIENKSTIKINETKTYFCEQMFDLLFQNKKIFTADFSDWGLVPNKTYIGAIPNIDNINLLKPFLLGLIDGDGHISFTKKSRTFGLVCHKNIIYWFKEQIQKLGYNGSFYLKMPKDKCYGRILIHKKNDLIALAKILEINKYPFIMERKWQDLKLAI